MSSTEEVVYDVAILGYGLAGPMLMMSSGREAIRPKLRGQRVL